MTIAVLIKQLAVPGIDTYQTRGGRAVSAPPIVLFGLAALAAGVTIGQVWEVGEHRTLDLLCQTTAKSGTSPTLDVTIQTSDDGVNDWQSAGAFAQKTAVGLAMSGVSASGSTPPTITLTSTAQTQPANLWIQCTGNAGALGTWTGQYSVDGGTTWVPFTSAATVEVVDANGTDLGIVINIAAGNAATDNVWKATTVGSERKRFTGLGRFVRAIANVGGSSTPTMTATVFGRAV